MPRTHIIVPTTGEDLDVLIDCLLGIHRCARAADRICLVANGARSATDAWLELDNHRPHGAVAAILPHRIGYTNAVNLGFRLLTEAGMDDDDYLCVVHDDVEVLGDFLTPLQNALDLGAAQIGPSLNMHPRGAYLESWCWAAKVRTIRGAMPSGVVYDLPSSPESCAQKLTEAILSRGRTGGGPDSVDVPLRHLSINKR